MMAGVMSDGWWGWDGVMDGGGDYDKVVVGTAMDGGLVGME